MPKDRKESTFFAVFWLVGPAGFEPAECGSQSPCENAYIWLCNANFSAALVPCWYLKNAYNNLRTILSPFHYVLYRQKNIVTVWTDQSFIIVLTMLLVYHMTGIFVQCIFVIVIP